MSSTVTVLLGSCVPPSTASGNSALKRSTRLAVKEKMAEP
jgi:hypothetical protein